MKKLAVGILAHVDAGKTTLSEAMLLTGGMIRQAGRVDHGDTFLDTYELEKQRGITIFSKQAALKWDGMDVTLLDTPGHVDFSAEMERTLQVLDYAILVISGSDGVQGHTRTLWRLLARYQIPVFLFVNKMDLAVGRREALLKELKEELDENCMDFGAPRTEEFYENAAVGSEEALEQFLETGEVTDGLLRQMISGRQIFPCYFGSALRVDGVKEFMEGLGEYTRMPDYPAQFGARIFKIGRDPQGNRLTYLKITGGRLSVKDIFDGEKVNQIRIYSGDKFEAVKEAGPGAVCAVTGLSRTAPGKGLGAEQFQSFPVLEPVLTCRVELPEGIDAASMLPKLKQLEEEEPELRLVWEETKQEIHAQIMGEIQMEILKSLIARRFGVDVTFGEQSIVYKETIAGTVEGVGHFEPLRHYAEVHLLLEPGEEGSGLSFATACSEDLLSRNWQRLILTHLEEKEHRGVLTGAPITDMKITLVSGRAHIKHTEGGDFRQAVYRAVRQGLREAESVLLEPFYDFSLEIPERFTGKAMTDLERLKARFEAPMIEDGRAILRGSAPAACMDGYQAAVTAYTGGQGRLECAFRGYGPCHNPEEVIAAAGYDPDADLENPCGSVFCIHGAGFMVEWDKVKEYMHIEAMSAADGQTPKLRTDARQDAASGLPGAARRSPEERFIGTDEVDAILARTFHANKKSDTYASKKRWGSRSKASTSASAPGPHPAGSYAESYWRGSSSHADAPGSDKGKTEKPSGKNTSLQKDYLLVDGYNIIFAWKGLKELADINIDSARGRLLDILCNYQGMKKCSVIAVFDAYRVQGHATEILDYHNIHVVYTKEAETADQYIEKFAHQNGRKYRVTVATSDYLEQIIIRGQGCGLLSARELEEEIEKMSIQIREECSRPESGSKRYLFDSVPEDVKRQIDGLPKG